MRANAGTRLGAFALPVLLFAFSQGGGCGGGGGKSTASGGANQNNARGAAAATNSNAGAGGAVGVGGAGTGAEGRSTPAVNADDAGGRGGDVARGEWGGRGARLNVRGDGAEVEFDCAHGRMGRLTTDARGNFDVRGVFVLERGGPVRSDEQEESRPARYTGHVEGKRMTLSVDLSDAGQDAEPMKFTLTHGATGRLTKCL